MEQGVEGFGIRDTWGVGGGQLETLGKPGESGREGNVGTRKWGKWVGGGGGVVEVGEWSETVGEGEGRNSGWQQERREVWNTVLTF